MISILRSIGYVTSYFMFLLPFNSSCLIGAESLRSAVTELHFADSTIQFPIWRDYWGHLNIENVEIVQNIDIPESLGVRFGIPTNFEGTRFDDLADFRFAQFEHEADFRQTEFKNRAMFRAAIFEANASFWAARFAGLASFRYVKASAGLDLSWCILPDTLDFRYMRLGRAVDLSNCLLPTSGNKCLIALYGTDLDKVKLRMEVFQLWFPSDTANSTLGKNSDGSLSTIIRPRPEDIQSIYAQLLSKFKNEGLSESYEILDKEYRKYEARQGSLFDRSFDWLQEWWWDYGYNKGKIFRNTIILLGLLALVPFFRYQKLYEEVYVIPFLETSQRRVSSRPKLPLRALRSIIYCAVVFFSLKIDFDKVQTSAHRRHPFLFSWLVVTYTIGIFCLGYIANFIFST